jgi:hypothetical protein
MRKYLFIVLIFIALHSFGQLSQGGFPLELPRFKSLSYTDKVVRLPYFNVDSIDDEDFESEFKSLKFAHSFHVSLRPDDSGTWYHTADYNIWQLEISSPGAFSLNVIFSTYHVPDGARLFVFDPQKQTILGAFTSSNNKEFNKLAIYPLPGDRLIIQYEEPVDADYKGQLEVGEVNHDFKGFFSRNNRWDRRISDWCNVDVNCEFKSGTELQRRAVCRIIAGDEIGTGTLVNNALNDGKPYLVSALHLFDNEEGATTALFDFNYESPFCTGLNGSDIQSVSGSNARASFDSLDFILVELSENPPATFRPYLAGWDATPVPPSNSNTIHHPNGDTKKISHDDGTCDSIHFNRTSLRNSHWRVANWETGATQGGSSGAPLFNKDKRVSGVLSGGAASCDKPSYDLFARIDKMWNYRKEKNKHLRSWLDPQNKGVLRIDGFDPYSSSSDRCDVISNFLVEDSAVVISISGKENYLTGTNSENITQVAEVFDGYSEATISGISIGIAELALKSRFPELNVRIYTGDSIPFYDEKIFKFSMRSLTAEAINYLEFPQPVDVKGKFFISIDIPSTDSLVLYQAKMRPFVGKNSLYVLQQDEWKKASDLLPASNQGTSLLMQVVLCGTVESPPDPATEGNDLFIAYPNPASEFLIVEFENRAPSHEVWLYDRLGRLILNDCFENRMYTELVVSDLSPGIYLLRVSNGSVSKTRSIAIR